MTARNIWESEGRARTPRPRENLIGQRFGSLLVVGVSARGVKRTFWECRCDCGGSIAAPACNLKKHHHTQSCGCQRKAMLRRRNAAMATHRMRYTPEYRAWRGLRERCENPRHNSYADYGGRGITVCARWRESFEAFLADMGRRPSSAHSIDRKDNDGNYELGNCRWATRSQQQRNRRGRPLHTLDGVTLNRCEWAERYGIDPRRLSRRLRTGWDFRRALETP